MSMIAILYNILLCAKRTTWISLLLLQCTVLFNHVADEPDKDIEDEPSPLTCPLGDSVSEDANEEDVSNYTTSNTCTTPEPGNF